LLHGAAETVINTWWTPCFPVLPTQKKLWATRNVLFPHFVLCL